MLCMRKIVYLAAAVAVCGGMPAEACHTDVHYTKTQIDDAHIRLYEHEDRLWDKDPARFDRKDPLIGELLSSQLVYENLLQDFEAHPKRFERQYPFLWRVLDGDMLYHEKHPFEPPTALNPLNAVPFHKKGHGDPGDPGMPRDPPPSFDPGGGSVPEPSSGVLMLTALTAGLIGAAARRTVRRIRRRS
jgi:hypothetical protein